MELHVSLVCAIPNARWLEYIPQLDLITHARLRHRGAALPIRPDAAGLGIDWDHAGDCRASDHLAATRNISGVEQCNAWEWSLD
ncbi:MAG: hypothetical protein V9G14_14485 [Cypionkella sp.]